MQHSFATTRRIRRNAFPVALNVQIVAEQGAAATIDFGEGRRVNLFLRGHEWVAMDISPGLPGTRDSVDWGRVLDTALSQTLNPKLAWEREKAEAAHSAAVADAVTVNAFAV